MTKSDVLQIRTSLRLTMREFAAVLDVSKSLVNEWEKGRHEINDEMAQHIRLRVHDYCHLQIGNLKSLLEIYADCTACPKIA